MNYGVTNGTWYVEKSNTVLNSIAVISKICELYIFDMQHDTRTKATLPRLDLNVLPVYEMGYTGRGVTVVILDDGIEGSHTDIRNNYVCIFLFLF